MVKGLAALAIAAAAMLGLSGCGFITPIATQMQYDPSDGVSARLGQVSLNNILVISDDGEAGHLVFSASNIGQSPASFVVGYPGKNPTVSTTVTVPAGSTVIFGALSPADLPSTVNAGPLNLPVVGAMPGALVEVFVQGPLADSQVLQVPVLDSRLAEYRHLAPTPAR